MTVGSFILFVDFMLAVRLADAMREKSAMDEIGYALRVVALVPVAWAVVIAWPFIEEWRARYGLTAMPREGNLLIVMGTLAVPQYAAGIQFLLPGWRDRVSDNAPSHIVPDERIVAVLSVFFLVAASAAIGCVWNRRTWLTAAACFWAPFVVLSTTFFSNPPGFFSVIWGSMDYWLSQQAVARGNQPEYYYFITIPVYEFLPLTLSIIAGLYYAIRGRADRALLAGGALVLIVLFLLMPPGFKIAKAPVFHVWVPFGIVLLGVMTLRMDMFTRFVFFWLIITSLSLTVASEKMPWLNVHIAIALAIVAGKFVGDLLERSDLRADLPKLDRLAPFAYAAVTSALAILVFIRFGPGSVASFGGWILAGVAAVSVGWAFSGYSRRTAMQVALVGFVSALTIFSLRAGILASWGHPNIPQTEAAYSSVSDKDYGDVPIELLVYTQTSGDIPELKKKLDQYAKETGQGENIKIVVDPVDGYTWPWAWYLRHYRADYPSIGPNYTPPKGDTGKPAVLFIASQDAANVNTGDAYNQGVPYHHRRWFPEEYRGDKGKYTTHDFFGDLFSISALNHWRDYWVRRTPPATLGTVDGVAFFPKDSGVEPPPAGPTVRQDGNQLVIGGQGTAKGQLNSPSDVSVDGSGNIYVADTNNNRIEKYDAQGNFAASAGGFGSEISLNQPWSIAVASDGSVFVADTWNHKMVKLDSDLNKVKEWGTGGQVDAGGDPMKLFGPRDVVLTSDGKLLITDTGNERVIEYTQDGDFVNQWGGTSVAAPLNFNEPVGLAIEPFGGDLYVADFWDQRIVHYDRDFNLKNEIKVDSWGSKAVTERAYLTLLPDGRLLASDPTNGKLLIFGADGSPQGSYDVPKEQNQATARPIGLAADGKNVYVAEAAGSVVRKIPLSEIVK